MSKTINQGENVVFRIELNDVENVDDPLTSGSLVIGLTYKIITFVTGDDFINVGATSNSTNNEFVATGTTPTVWTNSSTLQQITKVPITADQIVGCTVIAHQGRTVLASWTETSKATINGKTVATMVITDGLVRVEVLPNNTKTWFGDIEFNVAPEFLETDYFASGAQTDVVCFDDLLTVQPPCP
jgi:hypothetical protein